MIEFNLIVKEKQKTPGFQADEPMKTMVVALNPSIVISVARNRKNEEHTDISFGAMIVTADEEYDLVLQKIVDFNASHIYAHTEKETEVEDEKVICGICKKEVLKSICWKWVGHHHEGSGEFHCPDCR